MIIGQLVMDTPPRRREELMVAVIRYRDTRRPIELLQQDAQNYGLRRQTIVSIRTAYDCYLLPESVAPEFASLLRRQEQLENLNRNPSITAIQRIENRRELDSLDARMTNLYDREATRGRLYFARFLTDNTDLLAGTIINLTNPENTTRIIRIQSATRIEQPTSDLREYNTYQDYLRLRN